MRCFPYLAQYLFTIDFDCLFVFFFSNKSNIFQLLPIIAIFIGNHLPFEDKMCIVKPNAQNMHIVKYNQKLKTTKKKT